MLQEAQKAKEAREAAQAEAGITRMQEERSRQQAEEEILALHSASVVAKAQREAEADFLNEASKAKAQREQAEAEAALLAQAAELKVKPALKTYKIRALLLTGMCTFSGAARSC